MLIMTPEKQDKTLELSKHWSVDSTPARNEVIMKRTYPVKSEQGRGAGGGGFVDNRAMNIQMKWSANFLCEKNASKLQK